MPTKRALIVGINKYPFMEEKRQLGGCVNDAMLMKNILVNKFNFDEGNIVSLHDEAATLEGIRVAMDQLAEAVEQDDIVVFHYSGHGHNCKVKTEFTSEGSGKDNCILPTDDSEPGPDGKAILRDIRDHQINAWLQRLAKKTPYTTLIFDACHSGTMTRSSAGDTRVRSVPTAERPQTAEEMVRAAPADSGRVSASEKPGAGGWLTLSDNYVVIAGCRDTQTSKEGWFTRDGESVKHGLLSFNLTWALQRAKPGSTYRDVFENTCSGVVANVGTQNPQIEGAIDRELFGVKDIEPLRFVPLASVDGDTVILNGGAAHGLRRGSKWAVFPPGAKLADDTEQLGLVEISSVGALSSAARVLETSGELVATARCVEVEPVDQPEQLLVYLGELNTAARALLEPGIEHSTLMAVADTPEASTVQATIVESIEDLPAALPERVRTGFSGPSWVFLRDDDELAMPLHAANEAGVARVLLANLEKIAHRRNVLLLDNPDSSLDVEFNLYKYNGDEEPIFANGGTTEFAEDERMVLEIRNNEAERPVYFSVIWISANGEVGHFYPHRKANEALSPGKRVRIGHNRPLAAGLGEDFGADVGCETVKVMFSTTESDFSWLNQDSLRSGGDQTTDTPASRADWDAINRSFILTRAPRA